MNKVIEKNYFFLPLFLSLVSISILVLISILQKNKERRIRCGIIATSVVLDSFSQN
jgi:hypothetical protein